MGRPDTPHSYSYVPDIGRNLVLLGSRPEAFGRVWHLPNPPTRSTREIITDIYAELGQPGSHFGPQLADPARDRAVQPRGPRTVRDLLPVRSTVRRRPHSVQRSVRRPRHRLERDHPHHPRRLAPHRSTNCRRRERELMHPKLTACLLIVAPILTNAAFFALGSLFNYPDVLERTRRRSARRVPRRTRQRRRLVRRVGLLGCAARPDRDRCRTPVPESGDARRRASRHRCRRRAGHRPVALADPRARLRRRRRQRQP